MIRFADYTETASLFEHNKLDRIIILLSVDMMADCKLFKSLAAKYPDLEGKFNSDPKTKGRKPGDYIRIHVDAGVSIFFVIARVTEKFQPYMHDIVNVGLDRVVNVIKREIDKEASPPSCVLFPLPACDEIKLSNAVFIPAVADKMNIPGISVFILTACDYSHYIDRITEEAVYYKQDGWKSDWMLTLDDIILVEVIFQLNNLMHDFKLNKTNLVRCYRICHNHELHKNIEFYDTPFGPFFKLFLVKSNSLINHGLLMNTHHYSNLEPKKFSCILGAMWPTVRNMAYTQLKHHRDKIAMIVDEVRQDIIKSYREKGDADVGKPSFQKPQANNVPDNVFG